jgi:HlyD family secretion protein
MRALGWLHGIVAALVLVACDKPAPAGWAGYAEGDYVYVAAPLPGRLLTLAVSAGQGVKVGAPLFTLDDEAERAERAEADARLQGARANAADIASGKRREELAVIEAQLAQARAQAALAANDLSRQQQLVEQGFISKARLDDARAAVEQTRARVAELAAALQTARLPGRDEQRSAAQAQADAASQAVRASAWREREKQQRASVDAQVAQTFFRPGEFVPAGQPVLSLLPAANLKARFYVPETEIATIQPGQAVQLVCDGCGTPIAARISRIATEPEYTPPVIYSNERRATLVFLVEARPDTKDAARLRPGQPLDVRRAGPP